MTLRSYNIIYDMVDDVRAAMEGRLNTVEERTEIGQAEVPPPCILGPFCTSLLLYSTLLTTWGCRVLAHDPALQIGGSWSSCSQLIGHLPHK